MKINANFLFFILLVVTCDSAIKNSSSENFYPEREARIVSQENSTYFIDPDSGSDENIGTKKEAPWRTFKKINQLILSKGNKVEILSPGTFRESLFLIGQGTAELPITIKFAPGKYDFYPQEAFKSKFHISNANDAPDSLNAVAFYFLDSKHVKIKGHAAEIIFRGKVTMTRINNCENISVEDISFDYKRPTVSEFKVLKVTNDFADLQIHEDSQYEILDSVLVWKGEGWKHNVQDLWQEFDPQTQKVFRKQMPVNTMRFFEQAKNKVRVFFNENPGLTEGSIYQNRKTFRDYAAIFMQRSKDISWKNVKIYFMHGMGFVSQFCDNITFDALSVKPKEGSGRTCAAWADILHFSGCKGKIEVLNSYLSAANDDAVNVHGTYLRIIDTISDKKVKVRFMHPQTYGFDPFVVGDSVEFIRAKSLLPYSKNVVSSIEKLNEKEFELVFEQRIQSDIEANDVIENISWTADVIIRNNKIAYIPTRGILISTRGKVVIDENEFFKPHMSAILIAADANSWFESGCVKDVTISNNKFIDCGTPVINIHPENAEMIANEPVHRNIQIINNEFFLDKPLILSAKSTWDIKFSNNTIVSDGDSTMNDLLRMEACFNIELKNNRLNSKVVN